MANSSDSREVTENLGFCLFGATGTEKERREAALKKYHKSIWWKLALALANWSRAIDRWQRGRRRI